ncbi:MULTISPECIES: ComF family protein [Fusobacterium]|uniref:ComF family protein n=1 Tax=Fusobacterium TaxID=848 RepID=UPI0014768A3E|nr:MULTISPECIES: ComF family protein [Fusobacterium]NME35704.1 ComF family protein [Fusobacterium sp. FSA-380-WT-3A]
MFQNLNLHLRKFFFNNRCSVCNNLLSNSEIYICNNCKENFLHNNSLKKFNDVYYIFNYDKSFRNLIKNYKFQNRKYIGFFLGKLIEKTLKKVIEENNIDVIIPVPLNKKRLFSRGFNQVSYTLDILNIKYHDAARIKNTKHMSHLLDKNSRKFNINKAFYIPFQVENKNILIIDDVITTGNTIRELKKEIKNRGKVKSITVFSFSMASSFKKYNYGENHDNIN